MTRAEHQAEAERLLKVAKKASADLAHTVLSVAEMESAHRSIGHVIAMANVHSRLAMRGAS